MSTRLHAIPDTGQAKIGTGNPKVDQMESKTSIASVTKKAKICSTRKRRFKGKRISSTYGPLHLAQNHFAGFRSGGRGIERGETGRNEIWVDEPYTMGVIREELTGKSRFTGSV